MQFLRRLRSGRRLSSGRPTRCEKRAIVNERKAAQTAAEADFRAPKGVEADFWIAKRLSREKVVYLNELV